MEKKDIINELNKVYNGLETIKIQYNPKEDFAINLKEWRGILRRVIREMNKGEEVTIVDRKEGNGMSAMAIQLGDYLKDMGKPKLEVSKDRKEIAKIIDNVGKLHSSYITKEVSLEMADAILLYFIEKKEVKRR